MISKSFFISIVLLLGVTMTSVRADEAQEVSAALSKFFSLFETDCSNWVQVFTKSASFSHPKFPSGIVGSQALLDFCGKAKAAAQVQEFRQDGGAMLTREGDFLHVSSLTSMPLSTPRLHSSTLGSKASSWLVLLLVTRSLASSSSSLATLSPMSGLLTDKAITLHCLKVFFVIGSLGICQFSGSKTN